MSVALSHTVEGHVGYGFGAVRKAFVDNFARRRELGGGCCAYAHGEKAVDLWGGVRNKKTGEPWEQNTGNASHRLSGLICFRSRPM